MNREDLEITNSDTKRHLMWYAGYNLMGCVYIRSKFTVNALIMLRFMVRKKITSIDPAYLAICGNIEVRQNIEN